MTPPRTENERGQATVFFIFLVSLTFVLTACFVDVSRSLHAHGRSLEIAAQAARAGADQITQESLRTGDPHALRIDPGAARATAQAWLSGAGATGTVTVSPDATAVTVVARVPCRPTLLAALGFRDLSRPAGASATTLTALTAASGAGPAEPVALPALAALSAAGPEVS